MIVFQAAEERFLKDFIPRKSGVAMAAIRKIRRPIQSCGLVGLNSASCMHVPKARTAAYERAPLKSMHFYWWSLFW